MFQPLTIPDRELVCQQGFASQFENTIYLSGPAPTRSFTHYLLFEIIGNFCLGVSPLVHIYIYICMCLLISNYIIY